MNNYITILSEITQPVKPGRPALAVGCPLAVANLSLICPLRVSRFWPLGWSWFLAVGWLSGNRGDSVLAVVVSVMAVAKISRFVFSCRGFGFDCR